MYAALLLSLAACRTATTFPQEANDALCARAQACEGDASDCAVDVSGFVYRCDDGRYTDAGAERCLAAIEAAACEALAVPDACAEICEISGV